MIWDGDRFAMELGDFARSSLTFIAESDLQTYLEIRTILWHIFQDFSMEQKSDALIRAIYSFQNDLKMSQIVSSRDVG